MSSYRGPLNELSPSDREDIESFEPGYRDPDQLREDRDERKRLAEEDESDD